MKNPGPGSCSTTFLIAGDYCARNAYGHIFCDYLSPGSDNNTVPVSNIADANSNPLHDSNLWIHLRSHRHGTRNLSLTRNFIHLLPYPLPSRTPANLRPNLRYHNHMSLSNTTGSRILPP